MKVASVLDFSIDKQQYGPDPVILRKKGMESPLLRKYEIYKQRIESPEYMDYAIGKIAMEISHFLQKAI